MRRYECCEQHLRHARTTYGMHRLDVTRFGLSGGNSNYRESIESALDELADHIEKHLDVDEMLKFACVPRF